MTSTKRMDRIVRIMLHCARNPDRLAALPLVRELCAILGQPSPATMLRELVRSTFGESPMDRKLHSLIVECDLEGTTTQEGAAYQLNISRRQFHRLRSQAISEIAARISWLLDASGLDAADQPFGLLADSLAAINPSAASTIYTLLGSSRTPRARLMELRARADAGELLARSTFDELAVSDQAVGLAILAQSYLLNGTADDVIDGLVNEAHLAIRSAAGVFDDLARFELDYLAFLRSRARTDLRGMVASVGRMNAVGASRRSLRARAVAAAAETAARLGNGAEARRLLTDLRSDAFHRNNARQLAIANLIEAQVAFIDGRYDEAERSALAASIALEHFRPDALAAQILLGRVRALGTEDWNPRHLLRDRVQASYEHAALSLAFSRVLLASGDIKAARTQAWRAQRTSALYKYDGLNAAALVTLGAVHDALGEREPAQARYAEGLATFAGISDRLVAADLFQIAELPQRTFGPFDDAELIADAVLLRLRRATTDIAANALPAWRAAIRHLLLREREAVRPFAPLLARYRSVLAVVFELGAAVALPREQQTAFLTDVQQLADVR